MNKIKNKAVVLDKYYLIKDIFNILLNDIEKNKFKY